MSLVNCPECGKEVSDKSNLCIHCGCPLNANQQLNTSLFNKTDDEIALVNEGDKLRIDKKYSEAISFYEKAAVLGNAHSQLWLGNFYDRGLGVAVDYSKALYWFEMAAKQNNIDAINNIGFMYANGKGVSQNGQKAVEYYIKASEAGCGDASKNLAFLYENGKGVPKNFSLAVKYYNLAITQGCSDKVVLNNLGVLYMEGKGTTKDYNKAKELLSEAYKKGSVQAKNNLFALYSNIQSKSSSAIQPKSDLGTYYQNGAVRTPSKSENSEIDNNRKIACIIAIIFFTIVFVIIAAFNGSSSGEFNGSSSSDKSSYCSSCKRTFTNYDDRKSIAYSNMCENCHNNYEYSQNAIEGFKKYQERY